MITLKNVLMINALSSGATGAILVVFGNALISLFGLSSPQPLWFVGIFLIAFSIFVFVQSRANVLKPNAIMWITVLDSSWVVASLIIVLLQSFNLSFVGYLLIAAVAAWVALMAYLQMAGLRRLRPKV